MYAPWAKVALGAIRDSYLEHGTETDTRHVLDAVHSAMEGQPEDVRQGVPEDVRDKLIVRLAAWYLHNAVAAKALCAAAVESQEPN